MSNARTKAYITLRDYILEPEDFKGDTQTAMGLLELLRTMLDRGEAPVPRDEGPHPMTTPEDIGREFSARDGVLVIDPDRFDIARLRLLLPDGCKLAADIDETMASLQHRRTYRDKDRTP